MRAARGAQRAPAQYRAKGENDGEDADGRRVETGFAVGVVEREDRGRAQRAGEEGEEECRGAPGAGGGWCGAGFGVVAGGAGVELLGQGEDVAVAEARGGAVGDAVRFQARRDLQGVHRPDAQVVVAVQECLDGVGRTRRSPFAEVGHRVVSVAGTGVCRAHVGTGRGAGSVQWPGRRASAGAAKGWTPSRRARRAGVRVTVSR